MTVRLGGTPAHLPGATGQTPHVWDALPGAALLRVADVAHYLVTPQEIVVEPRGGSDEDIETFLARSVAAVRKRLEKYVVP